MRPRWFVALVAMICAITAALAFSGCTTILGTFDVASATAGAAGGTACDAGAQCSSTFCSDGVCCEAACNGTCEACNLPGSTGKCAPVPDGQDPALECPTTPLPPEDAGLLIVDASSDDSGDAGPAGDASVSDGGVSDAGITYGLPEAGVTTTDSQCAGSCNGQRACRYPGPERTCGTTFCTTPTAQGRASCDTKGHCLVGSETCEAYACADGSPGCKASCAGEADCQPTFFCDALSSTCKPKLGNGSACTSLAQCQDGHCVDGVCCNEGCKDLPGGTCTKPGQIGKCSCNACATGGCQLYYRDADGDGYGDSAGTVANLNAAPGCIGSPPAGFVANKDDCLDGPSTAPYVNVHPGQTSFFASPYVNAKGSNSYDYDCSAIEDKETQEYPGEYCGFCRSSKAGVFSCEQASTCTTVGEQAGLGCGLGGGGCTGKFCTILHCTTSGQSGFPTTVACGATSTVYHCGTCNGAGVTGNTYTSSIQRCH